MAWCCTCRLTAITRTSRATATTAPMWGATFVTPGAVGANALHCSSDAGSSAYKYVTLGVRPDLRFGSTTDFTVSYWVRQPASSTYTNLPFFPDAIGSTFGISSAQWRACDLRPTGVR